MDYMVRWKMVAPTTGLVVVTGIYEFHFKEHKLGFLKAKSKEARKLGYKFFWEDL